MLIPDFFVLLQEVNVAKESQHIQPASQMHGMPCIPNHPITTDVMRGPGEGYHSPLHLHHQSRSFPPRLQRTPSISSQSSVDSAPSRQSVGGVDSLAAYVLLMQLSRCRDIAVPRHRYAHSDPMDAAHCQVILASLIIWHARPVPCAPSRWTPAAAVLPRPMSVTCAPQVHPRVAWLPWRAAMPLCLPPT